MALSTKTRRQMEVTLASKARAKEVCDALDAAATGTPAAPLATTAAMTLWVDQAVGSDSNDGLTAGTAFATINKAVAAIPLMVKHTCTIKVKAGTYAETIVDGHIYADFPAMIIIEGQDFITPTLGSGSITTGTLGAVSSYSRTVAGAAWTVNELKGYMLQITSGALNGKYYPIAGNAAGTIDCPQASASLNSATFNIVDPAVVITKGSGRSASTWIANVGYSDTTVGATGMIFRRLRFNPASGSGLWVDAGFARMEECTQRSGGFISVRTNSHLSTVAVDSCFLSGSTVPAQFAPCYYASLNLCAVDGGGNCIQVNTVGQAIDITDTWCQNASSVGVFISATTSVRVTMSGAKNLIRNCPKGISSFGPHRGLISATDIVATGTTGLFLDGTGPDSQYWRLSNCKITGMTANGVHIESLYTSLQLAGTTDISGNTGFGVKCVDIATRINAFTNISIESGVTMGTNTAGDLSIDNASTSSTIAALRADADKTIVDAVRFNRMNAL